MNIESLSFSPGVKFVSTAERIRYSYNDEWVEFVRLPGATLGRVSASPSVMRFLDDHYSLSATGNGERWWTWSGAKELIEAAARKLMPVDEYASCEEVAREREKLSQEIRNEGITEETSVATVRKYQWKLRDLLIKERGACEISGVKEPQLLVASHIKAWAACEGDGNERLDPENVLLLASNWDALFDKYLISFDPATGRMVKSNRVTDQTLKSFGVFQDWRQSVRIRVDTDRRSAYLKWHNEKMSEKDALS